FSSVGSNPLGFAEEAAPWRLRSAQFPSKVGGRPLRCARCGRPCAFLLQLYAPLPGRPDAFHRGLFVFCCRGPACYRPGMRESLGELTSYKMVRV
uniref:Uncharacterized protein n=1 Tax=Gopherus agassizii TaxID=38772 RepID=A0A452IIV8_9SAUR